MGAVAGISGHQELPLLSAYLAPEERILRGCRPYSYLLRTER
jgi:hypothetical protein